jgi:hypothetical protein
MRKLTGSFALWLAATAVIVIFYHFGGFTIPASILLGGCFTVFGVWILGIYQIVAFKPYSVQFFINFEALREDFGIVKDSEATDREEIARELYNFTAISAALFVHYREYVYRTANELNLAGRSTRTDDEYRSAIRFGDTISGRLKFSTDWGDTRTNIFWFPRFIFGHGRKGFELKVQVVPAWWSEYKKHLSSELRDLPVDYDGSIVLAHLPYGYFPEHVRRFYEPMSLFYPFDRIHRRWKSKMSKHGWTVTEADEEISSRYLIVRYRGIWPAS